MKNRRKNQLCLLLRNGVVGSSISKTQKGHPTPVGNDRSERLLASSPERRDERQIIFAGSGQEALALGDSLMGGCHPAARHGQPRRGYSGRTSERSRDVVVSRVTCEVQGDEKLGLRRSRLFSKRRSRSTLF